MLSVSIDPESPKAYRQHDTVQSFYYDSLKEEARRAWHRRAGKYYLERSTEPPLKAAWHLWEAQETETLIPLLIRHARHFSNTYPARELDLLAVKSMAAVPNAPGRQAQLNLVRGDFNALSQWKTARNAYQSAFELARHISDPLEQRALQAKACLGLVAVLRQQDEVKEALVMLDKNKGLFQSKDNPSAPVAYKQRGALLSMGGQQLEAEEALKTAKRLATTLELKATYNERNEWRNLLSDIQTNLGITQALQGKWYTARKAYEKSVILDEQTGNTSGMLTSLHNLGLDGDDFGRNAKDWTKAREAYERELQQAEKLGAHEHLFQAHLGLGILRSEEGDDHRALEHLGKARQFALVQGSETNQCYVLPVLAGVFIGRGCLVAALDAGLCSPLPTEPFATSRT